MFIAALFKQLRYGRNLSFYQQIINKEDVECVCVIKYYSDIKKKEILPFTIIWMDLEGIILVK